MQNNPINYPNVPYSPRFRSTVRQAFHLWSSQVKIKSITSLTLEFEEAMSADEADITIMWAEGEQCSIKIG
jgi:hypothetical protein